MITSCVVGTRKTERGTRVSRKAEKARVRAHPGPTEFAPRQSGREREGRCQRLSERKRRAGLPSAGAGCVGADLGVTWWSWCKQSADVKSEHGRIPVSHHVYFNLKQCFFLPPANLAAG